MPRKFAFLSLTAALASVVVALVMLALSASAASPPIEPNTPTGSILLEVNYSHDWVIATTVPPGNVAITARRNGMVIATISGLTDASGTYRSHEHDGDWSPSHPDLRPGDSVEAVTAGASASVNPIGEITGAVDMGTDTVSGAIHAPALAPQVLDVKCEVWVQNANVPPIWDTNVPADGGTYACNFGAGYGIQPGDNIAVRYFEPDGDQVIGVFRSPAPDLAVDIWPEGNSSVRPGGRAVYNVRYRNQGDAPAANVVLTGTLLTGTSFVTATLGVTPAEPPGEVTWSLGTVPPGAQVHFFVILGNSLAPNASLQHIVDIGTTSQGDNLSNNHGEANSNVVSDLPDLNVGQQINPYDPLPGDTYRITVDYGNNGPVPGGPVSLHVQLADDTTLHNWASENAYGSLWKLVSSTGGHLIFNAPALPSRFGDRLRLDVRIALAVPANTKLVSTVWIEEAFDSNPSNNGPFDRDVWTRLEQRPDLRVGKAWGYGQLVQGGHAIFDLDYSNDGNVVQTGVRLTDTLPTGTTFVTSTVDSSWGESYALPPVHQGGGVVAWNIGTLQPGQGGHFKVELALDAVQAGSTITNTAEIRGLASDRSWWNNRAGSIEHVQGPGANLRLLKNSFWEWPGQVRFETQFENIGTTIVENVRITETLPSGLDFTGDSWHNWWRDINVTYFPATRQVVWTTSRLEPQWSGKVNFRLNVPGAQMNQQGLVFTSTAQITLPAGELTPADNRATAVAFTGPDLYINKSLSAGDLVPGGVVTFTITLGNRNNGPWNTGQPQQGSPATVMTDTLPAGMDFLRVTDTAFPGQTFNPSRRNGNVLTWTGGGMCAGCRAQFQLTARISDTVPGLAQLTNTIEIVDVVPGDIEPYIRNNRATWQGTVVPTYGVGLLPAASALSGRPGTVVTHNLRLTNTGNAPATFDLSHGVHTWNVEYTQAAVVLAPGAWVDVPVRVTVPPLAGLAQVSDAVSVTVTVRAEPGRQATAVLTTNANVAHVYLPLSKR